MTTKHQVHNLIILDESGSMQSIKNSIIQGFNEIVQTMQGIEKNFPEQEHFISLISFNGLGTKLLHFIDPVSNLKQIDASKYQPDASTPLYDAIGLGITKMKQVLEGKTDYNVLVTILTDGEENASHQYSGGLIKNMITNLSQNNWTFTYIGTDHAVEKTAVSLSITNTIQFSKDESGVKEMFVKENKSREYYSQKIRAKMDTSKGFYDDEPSQ